MPTVAETRVDAITRSRVIRRINALTAMVFGGLLSVLLALMFPPQILGWFVGLTAGLLYANAFEYVFHRFLLHAFSNYLQQRHELHHSTWGAPDEALYVNFTESPVVVVILFAANAIPFVAAEWLLHVGIASGVLVGFVVYFVGFEEIHARVHLNGWLPSWMWFAGRHHLKHHANSDEHFNVFLPLCDWLFRSAKH